MRSMPVERIGIIGGGPAGLATAKVLAQNGIPFEVLEREDDFGGTWYFGRSSGKVYESTHLISSKNNTQFSDFPMPADYPDYPSHRLFLQYLRSVARHFGLYESASFGAAVRRVTPEGAHWRVELEEGEPRVYAGLMIATGRLSVPRVPEYPGCFDGKILHAAEYRSAEILRGQRVLIVGGGNSGCDIAVDAAHVAARTVHSMRRGYHFMPKYIHGKPTQDWMMQSAGSFASTAEFWRHAREVFQAAGFRGTDYGLPEPDHEIDQAHPILNSQLLYHIGHGDIVPRPDVERFDGRRVHFTDGSTDEVDVVLFATGYDIALPFLDESVLGWRDGIPDLFLYTFHRTHPNLFFGGLLNAPSGFGNLANAAGQALVAYLRAWSQDTAAFRRFCERKRGPDPELGQGRYYEAARHRYELDAWKLLKALNSLRARLEEDGDDELCEPGRRVALRAILEDVAAQRISEDEALERLGALDASSATPPARSDESAQVSLAGRDPGARLLEDVIEHLVALLHVPREELDVDQPLSDFGVDSILASELLNGVQRRYGIALPPTVLFEYRDIRSFVDHLASVHGETIARALGDRAQPCARAEHAERGPDVFRDGQGSPLLLIGGLGTTWQVWRDTIARLRGRHAIAVYHPPGHGRSPYDGERLALQPMVEQIAELLAQMPGEGGVPVVGWSLGGILAAALAARHPQKVRGLVLVCTTACPRALGGSAKGVLAEIQAHPRAREWLDQAAGSLALDPAVLGGYRDLLATIDLRPELPAIRTPTLIVSGGKDPYMSAAAARDLEQRIAGARHRELADCGHFPMLTEQEDFMRTLTDFLGALQSPDSRAGTQELR
jgi:cation diffusion facilitator CzcD-associated flavoprotein CzcO/pimeloyl-ACP methyl ester carboxylesterase/acyl carrier protein